MNKKLTIKNLIATIILQFFLIVSGFIVPRIILSFFGSDVNGLVSSITQFLNFIQILEGGMSSVVIAALLKNLAKGETEKINSVIASANSFFKKIAFIYFGYALCVAFLYPLIVHITLDYFTLVSLILIIAGGTFAQYFFALTNRTLITADRRGYIVSLVQCASIVLNILFTILIAKFYPNILLLKACASIAYVLQPLVFGFYVKKHYKIDKKARRDPQVFKQWRYSFGHNLAYFIHSNTDIVVLTLFSSLSSVSIYSVYMSVIGALKSFVVAISAAIKPSFGNVYVSNNLEKANEVFDYYELGINFISSLFFSCCMVLIVPFVMVYTKGITDANYYQPIFAFLLCVSEMIYCMRDPYVSAAYNAGDFKQTAKYAYIEAAINVISSLILIFSLQLIGVAIGTLLAMIYRGIMHGIYLKKHILYRNLCKWIKGLVISGLSVATVFLIFFFWKPISVTNYISWFLLALICFSISLCICLFLFGMGYFKTISRLVKNYFFKKTRKGHENDF